MSCQNTNCQSDRILKVTAKCSDCCFLSINGKEKSDYVPRDMGIGGGDNIRLAICLDCGQVQGTYPIAQSDLELQDD